VKKPKRIIAPEIQVKGRIMGNQTKNATIPKRAATKKPGVGEVKGRLKYHSIPFKPKPTLLLDIAPAEENAETTSGFPPEFTPHDDAGPE
jgi:hypothetical protein